MRLVREDVPGTTLLNLIEIFTEEIVARLQRIKDALAATDLGRAEYEAHTLSGTSGTFGAMRLQALARDLERRCRTGDAAGARHVLTSLEPALNEACAVFRTYADSNANS